MISLTDLRARRVVPSWQEAVAVVQELLQTVAHLKGQGAPLPDVDHIALIANGEVVTLPGGAPTGNPVRQAASLLQMLLEGTTAPPELRALADGNAVEVPPIPSMAEFTRQLAFFERPGRRSDVEQLVSRAMSADAQDRAEEELRRLKERAVEAAELETVAMEMPKRQRSRLGRQGIAVLAFVLAGAVVAGAWWVYAWSQGRASSSPAQTAVTPGAAGGEDADQQSGPGNGTASEEPPAVEAPTASTAGEGATEEGSFLDRTRASIRRVVQSAFGSSDAESAPTAALPEPQLPPDAARATASKPRRIAAAPPAAGGAPAAEPPQVSTTSAGDLSLQPEPQSVGAASEPQAIVYSQTDPDVRPALLLRPVLPATPPPDVPPDQIGTLELIVDEFGDVEHVRLISPANRFHERMLVAHAKSWKFRPAMRDGRPVKYRTVVRLTI